MGRETVDGLAFIRSKGETGKKEVFTGPHAMRDKKKGETRGMGRTPKKT